jgi:tetratricopeptide (TPR) repeat protein
VKLPLQLRHVPRLATEPGAWFLPGDSTARWLEELTRCGLADADTRLFVVPTSAADRTPAGLLVVPGRGDAPAPQPSGLACQLVAGRVFVPLDAVLHPPVNDAELRHLCLLPVNFFHPAFGLSGFETESTRRVWDLLEPPEERAEDWNAARPGAPALPELRAVQLAQPPSLEDIFGEAEADIATESPLDLPPASDEPRENPLANSARAIRRSVADAVAKFTQLFPHTASRPTWINDLKDWANRQLRGVSEQLEQLRNKELNRLVNLFATDPEAALRHAIPLSAFPHRGVAPPGGQLGSRSPNFDLSRLGGLAVDFWQVPADLQELLRRHYRETANRELQLGRYRRAAYIYAELLGDVVSAANALKQGRHYREAAVLYEVHLKNPLEAARCLAEGGLLAEAIDRYEKLARWLDVADLQERLGNQPAAHAAVRRVVEERLAQDDRLGAAKLVEERLHETDEALELLLRGWPHSCQAGGCVSAAFQMLARLGRHEVALEQLARFQRETPPSQVLPLLQALSGPARDYPDARVRHRATDFSRVLIARQLEEETLSSDETARLLECLVRLAPEDRLLARDANRHLANCREAERRAPRATPPRMPGNQPAVVRRFELPRQLEWLQLRKESYWFFAVGVTPNRLTLIRGIWEGEQQSLSWDCPAVVARNSLVLEPTSERGEAVVLATFTGPDFTEKRFPATDVCFDQACMAGTPAWLKPQHWPAAFGEESVWAAHVAGGRVVLSCLDKRGTLRQTLDATDDLLGGAERDENSRVCLTALDSGVAVALGNRLIVTRSEGGFTRLELPSRAMGLCATPPHTRQGVAVLLTQGAVLHWVGTPGLIALDSDLHSPLGTFVPGGPLVLVSASRLLLLEVDSPGAHKVTRMELSGQRPVGVCATASPGQFAVLGEQGEMTVYRVPQ